MNALELKLQNPALVFLMNEFRITRQLTNIIL